MKECCWCLAGYTIWNALRWTTWRGFDGACLTGWPLSTARLELLYDGSGYLWFGIYPPVCTTHQHALGTTWENNSSIDAISQTKSGWRLRPWHCEITQKQSVNRFCSGSIDLVPIQFHSSVSSALSKGWALQCRALFSALDVSSWGLSTFISHQT